MEKSLQALFKMFGNVSLYTGMRLNLWFRRSTNDGL